MSSSDFTAMLYQMTTRLFAVAVALAAAGSAVSADDVPRLGALTPLADGVYVYEHLDPTKQGVSVNNLVVVSSGGVLIADGQGTVENTRALVAAVAAITSAPIRYVVVGSVHGDHRGGDAGFPPSAAVITTRTDLALGGREVRVLMLGRAHTGSDLEVWLPKERVLYMSEAFSNRIFPSMANSYPSEWVAALTQAEALDARVYVPAHGAIDAAKDWTRGGVRTYRGALEQVLAEGRRLHDATIAVDQAPARATWGAFASWTRLAENAAGALKRVYMEIDGAL